MKYTLLVSLALLLSYSVVAQQINWESIVTSIHDKTNLRNLTQRLETEKQQALQQQDDAVAARCYWYQMQIADQQTEDSLYFKNSFFIDSILNSKPKPFLQYIMLMLKAKRVAVFRQRYYYRNNKNLFTIPAGVTDYRQLDNTALDSLVKEYLLQAQQISESLPLKKDIAKLMWLSGDPMLFLFKPDYTDLIFAERLYYTSSQLPYSIIKSDQWMLLSPDQFIGAKETPEGIDEIHEPMYIIYRQWAKYHAHDPAAFYFIESLARKYFFTRSFTAVSNRPDSTLQRYENYLQQLLQSPYNTVKAAAVQQLCIQWKTLGDRYSDAFSAYNSQEAFDSSYRYYYVRSLELFEQNSQLLDSFLFIKHNLHSLKNSILEKKSGIQSFSNYLPGDSINLHFNFKNINWLHIKIVKLSVGSVNIYYEKEAWQKELIKMPAYTTLSIALPATNDFQAHSTIINAGSLPAGRYAIVFSDSLIAAGSKVNYTIVNVTNIAVVNSGSRVFVLDRKTGYPLMNAKLQVSYKPVYNEPATKTAVKKVNAAGYTIVNEKHIINTIAIYGTDTTAVSVNEATEDIPDYVYDKDTEDDLLDYYEDNLKMHLFTDRAIYRPGQTVYFKGILLTRNPATGEPVVFNKSNLHFPLLQKLFNKELKAFEKKELAIYIKDALGKTLDTIKVRPNEFGSFAGSYKINTKAVTGQWQLDAGDIDTDSQEGNFKVEEYKRPTFELQLQKPTNYLQLGDSFFVKAKVRSFAGAQLYNTMVDYSITANFHHLVKDSLTGYDNDVNESIELADTTGYTDNKGELLIKVPNDFLKSYHFNNSQFSEIKYSLEVTAYDPNGENYDETLDVRLSNRPVKIDFSLANAYERNSLGGITVTTKNEFCGNLSKIVEAKIFSLNKKIAHESTGDYLDYNLQNGQWKYGLTGSSTASQVDTVLLYTTRLLSNNDKLVLPKNLLPTGDYSLEISFKENDSLKGRRTRNFSVFDSSENTFPGTENNYYQLPVNSIAAGENMEWYFGTREKDLYAVYEIQYYAKSKKGIRKKQLYELKKLQAGISRFNFKMPEDAVNEITITQLYIRNNTLNKKTTTVYTLQKATTEPELVIEQYRNKLTPGSKETFVISIKTKNDNIAAELMTTMYDASLDKIEKQLWQKPTDRNRYYLNTNWQSNISASNYTLLPNHFPATKNLEPEEDLQPLWWLNPLDYAYGDVNLIKKIYSGQGSNDELNERRLRANSYDVTVIGYGSRKYLSEVVVTTALGIKRSGTPGSSEFIRLRGAATAAGNDPLVIIDGVLYTGDINKFDPAAVTDMVVLKGADATAIYGSKAASGVILVSTKGMVELPKAAEAPVLIRKDFSETAFFFPQVHADAAGYYTISFTMPESVTEWNWKMLAHTKDARFVYAQRTVNTQLPLMVQPNMPRFLFQGDEINLQTRITNLDTTDLSGIADCIIEDAITGEDITASITPFIKQDFSVQKKSSNTVAYRLKIPVDFLHPLKITITARAGSFSDGEAYTIPVLNRKILVAQTIPFVYNNTADSSIQSPSLPADAIPYGVGLYIAAKPQAAMVNALPYLAFYPYNCAEQTFNKMLSHAIAVKIIQTDSIAQRSIQEQQQLPEQNNNAALPDEPGEATMPWLQLAHQTTLHQQQLFKLFDTIQSRSMIDKYIGDLAALQNTDGGITWFKGGKSDPYISAYLLAGFGKLKKDSIPFLFNQYGKNNFKIVPSLLAYCDYLFKSSRQSLYEGITYLNARTYWVKEYPFTKSQEIIIDSLLIESWKKITTNDLGKQALLILVSMRYGGKENIFYKKAISQLESIRQLAINDKANGIRWKDMSNADDFDNSDEESIALLAEAFDETAYSKEVVKGILQWLLVAKEQHNWRTTKATAAVVNLLYRHQSTATGIPATLTAVAGNDTIAVTNNLLKGRLFDFTQLNNFPPAIQLKNTGAQAATGGITYYYFTANPPVSSLYNTVKISKQLFKFTKEDKWELINENSVVKIGDKIKTIITIETPRQLKYVFIDEKRPAASEPADAASDYQYGKGFSYYRSVRDAGYQFFAEQVPSGISTLQYETVTAKEGIFSSGTVSLQCMYQPQLRAYGAGTMLTVIK
jgi:TonB-dependent SusC/RagA subfamily outer membrane receptor